jgi:hypothetical protein
MNQAVTTGPMKHVGQVINNNQPGDQFIVDGHPNNTVPVGTPVYCTANDRILPPLGSFMGSEGGFFAGVVQINGRRHGVVVAPRAEGEFTGEWGNYGTRIDGADHVGDGLTNTLAMAAAGSPIASKVHALNINDKTDWYVPARDELEACYRNLKPGADENACSFRDGDNPSSVPPGLPYTKASPVQTAVEAFHADGPEAFDGSTWYWSSSQYSAYRAFVQDFSDGYQDGSRKGFEWRVRAVRRFIID